MGFNPFGDGRSILRAAAAHWKVAFCMAPEAKLAVERVIFRLQQREKTAK
jgi:hypothetical protein